MECRVAWRRCRDGRGVRHHLPRVVFPGGQQLGQVGGDPLPLWHVGLVCGLDALPLNQTSLEVEGAAQEVGSCCHLLAYRRFVFAVDTGGSA